MGLVTAVVLIHGGSFAGSCWELVVDELRRRGTPVLAVDLPGRRARPALPEGVTIDQAAASVVADIDAAGFDDVVLVGHSLAGASMPATIGELGDRVRHAVFVACTVPDHGRSCLDMLPSDMQQFARSALEAGEVGMLSPEMARHVFGNDLNDEQFAWMLERMVPEGAPGLLLEPVDLSPLRSAFPRTWVRPLRDAIVDPEGQLRFAATVGDCEVIDLDAGHMCMISQPEKLADIIDHIAQRA
jgi:pimeloyl-ACP methyl ester carboxylesterase